MGFIEKIVSYLVKARKLTFAFVLALVASIIYLVGFPSYNGELGGLDSQENEEFQKLKTIDSTFRNGQTYYFLCTPKTNNTHRIFERVDSLSSRIIAKYPTARIVTPVPFFKKMRRYFGADASEWNQFIEKADKVPLLNQLIADNKKGFAVILSASENTTIDTDQIDKIVTSSLSSELNIESLSEQHLTKIIGETLASEMIWITGLILLLFSIYAVYMIRNVRGILFILFLIIISLLAVPLLFSLLGYAINVISIISLPIVLILVLGDALHLIAGANRFYNENDDSIRTSLIIKRLVIPSFYSSLTTAVAFLSFYFFSESEFVRQFGLVTSLAVMIEFFITFFVSPLLLFKTRIASLRDFNLLKFSGFLSRNRRKLTMIMGVMTIVSLFILPRLVIDSSPDSYFPQDHELTARYNYFKANYYAPLSVNVLVKNNQIHSDSTRNNTFDRAYNLTKSLRELDYVESVSSSADVFHFKNKMGVTVNLFNHLNENDPYYDYNEDVYFLDVKLKDLKKTDDLLNWINKYNQRQGVQITTASREKMYNEVNRAMTISLLESLLTSGFGIFLVFFILTRSIKLSLLSLLPNLVPIGITLIFFYLLGFELNLLTSLTLVISLGLLDDDTVHIIYRRLILNEEMEELNFSVISSAMLLSMAFLIFTISDFEPVVIFGIICSIIFVVGLLSELVIFRWIIDVFKLHNSMPKNTASKKE